MSALSSLGTLYRDADGVEVWAIRDASGALVADGVASDHDAAAIADEVSGS